MGTPASRENGSAVATQLRTLTPRARRAIGATDLALGVADTIFDVVGELLDEENHQDLEATIERVAERLGTLVPGTSRDARIRALVRWATTYGPDALAGLFKTYERRHQFLNRLIGSAAIARLDQAIRADVELALLAARRIVRSLIPLAVAVEDCSAVASPSATGEEDGLDERNFTSALLTLDESIDLFIDKKGYALDGQLARSDERRALGIAIDGVVEIARQMRRAETDAQMAYADPALARKLRGFDQALANSEDGVSQAANSLVEFIDRLLRGAFSDTEVLEWITNHYPDRDELTFPRHGIRTPTKLGQALCFVSGGAAPPEDPLLFEVAAKALIATRRKAEALKHSDSGSSAEAKMLGDMLGITRASLTVAMRITWAPIGKSSPDSLRARLAGSSRAKQSKDLPPPGTRGGGPKHAQLRDSRPRDGLVSASDDVAMTLG